MRLTRASSKLSTSPLMAFGNSRDRDCLASHLHRAQTGSCVARLLCAVRRARSTGMKRMPVVALQIQRQRQLRYQHFLDFPGRRRWDPGHQGIRHPVGKPRLDPLRRSGDRRYPRDAVRYSEPLSASTLECEAQGRPGCISFREVEQHETITNLVSARCCRLGGAPFSEGAGFRRDANIEQNSALSVQTIMDRHPRRHAAEIPSIHARHSRHGTGRVSTLARVHKRDGPRNESMKGSLSKLMRQRRPSPAEPRTAPPECDLPSFNFARIVLT